MGPNQTRLHQNLNYFHRRSEFITEITFYVSTRSSVMASIKMTFLPKVGTSLWSAYDECDPDRDNEPRLSVRHPDNCRITVFDLRDGHDASSSWIRNWQKLQSMTIWANFWKVDSWPWAVKWFNEDVSYSPYCCSFIFPNYLFLILK